jgi:hypothetical protein
VLVSRTVRGSCGVDVTVLATDLLAEITRSGTALPPARDSGWRWPLPPARSRSAESLPLPEVRRIAAAAAGALRTASVEGVGGRVVGERVLRDALLDHVAVLVTTESGARVEVSQRLVQGVARMGFLGPSAPADDHVVDTDDQVAALGTVEVRLAGRWVSLAAPYGSAWLPPVSQLAVRPVETRTNG